MSDGKDELRELKRRLMELKAHPADTQHEELMIIVGQILDWMIDNAPTPNWDEADYEADW